jgi:hypothetical protein
LQSVEVIGGALRVGSSGEYRARVVFQDGQPIGKVGRMILTRLRRQVEIGGKKSRTELGDLS